MQLTKTYRLTWKDSKVQSIGKYGEGSVTGCLNGFEADTKQEITDKIAELSLTMTEDQEKEWALIS